MLLHAANASRYVPTATDGHYESWFLRGNHPSEPRAFWIRYTIFAPRGPIEQHVGELWAVVFDGTSHRHFAVRTEVPWARCHASPSRLDVAIGDAVLIDGEARGFAHHAELRAHTQHGVRWSLAWDHGDAPLELLPSRLYRAPLPRAKSLVPRPNITFRGHLELDGTTLHVDGWRGSQNHNWGARHTDAYAWGQVVGFDGADDVVLEAASARIALGPVLSPPLTVAVLREGEREHRLHAVTTALRARASFAPFRWSFASREGATSLDVRFEASRDDFVALRYGNPPGGAKICLNTKIARAEVTLREGGRERTYRTAHRAAFELLDDAGLRDLVVVAGVD